MIDDRLSLSITHADGRVTIWGPDEVNASDILGDLTFSTQIPGGFRDLTCSLMRRIDLEYPDLGLFDHVRVYTTHGNRTVWEGRMVQFPRSHGDGFQIVPGAVGHSAALTDNPTFREIYVDRDLSRWKGGSVQRRLNNVGSFTANDPTVIPDETTGQPSLSTTFTGAFVAAAKGLGEALYDSGGIPLGSLYYAWKKNANVSSADANWVWDTALSTDDILTSTDASGNLRAAGPGTGTLTATGAAKLFAFLQHYYNTGPAGVDNTEYAIFWTCLALYGTHGLTKQGSESATSAKGFFASDIVQDIVERTAPSLTIGEIEATTFVIPQCVFLDPVTGETAIQAVNDYHGFDWGVYDNKEFFYRDSDPDRLTWQARLSDGARLDLEGDTAEQVFNGVFVTYTEPGGAKKTVGPPGALADATDASLADTSSTNPVNSHGLGPRPRPITIPDVTTTASAIQIGQVALAQQALPQRRGTLTLTGTVTHPTEGEVPVSRMRAGDYVSIPDHPATVPRRIIETRYTHASRQMVCNLDNTPYTLDSILQRMGASLVGVL